MKKEKELRFNIFPKAKYKLYITNTLRYSFVTTRYNEDDSIKMLLDRIKGSTYIDRVYYKITKTKENKEETIKKGRV